MCIVQSTLLYQVYITLVNLNILGVRPDSNPGPQVVSLLSYHYTITVATKMRFVESLLMLTHPMANNSHFVLGSYDDFNVVRMNE